MFAILRTVRVSTLTVACAVMICAGPGLQPVQAQNNGFQRQSVGGIMIDAQGLVSAGSLQDQARLREAMTAVYSSLEKPIVDVSQPSNLRKISLRKLQEKLQANGTITDDVMFLAGLQEIRHVFVFPEQKDIVLAGFGEGWKMDEKGYVVGLTTGRPVLVFDDLLVALRAAFRSPGSPLSCSIDPTQDGLKDLQAFASTLTRAPADRKGLEAVIQEKLGPQSITIDGVDPTSHLARVMLAADYRMKRIAMALDRSPVAGLPSYLSMITSGGGRGVNNMLPRWWLATNYDPLTHDGDKVAWELSGPRVKAMSEEDRLQSDGTIQRGARQGGPTQRWADMMTAKYAELALKDPVFGQLRGIMDLAVVATLISSEGLADRAGLNLDTFLNRLPIVEFPAPTQTPSIAQSMLKGSQLVISASGGVEIQPLAVVQQQRTKDALAPVRQSAAPQESTRWWWD